MTSRQIGASKNALKIENVVKLLTLAKHKFCERSPNFMTSKIVVWN